jgi:hypothetical protein
MAEPRPAERVGSWMKFLDPAGSVLTGTVKYAISRHWITHKPAYFVQANVWNGDVHEEQVVEWGPVNK